jgi:hypothetical protein
MKKNSIDYATVITGDSLIKKARKALKIAKQFKKEDITIISSSIKLHNPFSFKNCSINTKLIIFEKTNGFSDFTKFSEFITCGIEVNKRGQDPFVIFPEIVIISSYQSVHDASLIMKQSFERRFKVIHID